MKVTKVLSFIMEPPFNETLSLGATDIKREFFTVKFYFIVYLNEFLESDLMFLVFLQEAVKSQLKRGVDLITNEVKPADHEFDIFVA